MEYKEFQIPPLSLQGKAKAESIFNRMRGSIQLPKVGPLGLSERSELELQEFEGQLDKILHIPEDSGRVALNLEDRKKYALDHWSTSRGSEFELYRGILSRPDLFKILFNQASPEVQEAYQNFIKKNKQGYKPNDEDRDSLYKAVDDSAGINLADYEESKKKVRRESERFYSDLEGEKTVSVDDLTKSYITMLKVSLAHARLENWILEKRFRFFDQLAAKAGLKIINVPHHPDGFIWIKKYDVNLPKEVRDEIQNILDRLHEVLIKGNSGIVRWESKDEFDSKFGQTIADVQKQIDEEILDAKLPKDKTMPPEDIADQSNLARQRSAYLLNGSPDELVEKLFENASPKIRDAFRRYKEIYKGKWYKDLVLTDINEELGLKSPESGLPVTVMSYAHIIDRVLESITSNAEDIITVIVARNVNARRQISFEGELVEQQAKYFKDLAEKASLKIITGPRGWPVLAEKRSAR